ncbi:hypothetical protein BC567DRAFT_225022 [Phyllosticta citribraziliensis]
MEGLIRDSIDSFFDDAEAQAQLDLRYTKVLTIVEDAYQQYRNLHSETNGEPDSETSTFEGFGSPPKDSNTASSDDDTSKSFVENGGSVEGSDRTSHATSTLSTTAAGSGFSEDDMEIDEVRVAGCVFCLASLLTRLKRKWPRRARAHCTPTSPHLASGSSRPMQGRPLQAHCDLQAH